MIDPETKKPKMIDPKDSTTVFVDVTAYNSKNYYIQGEVARPGQVAGHGQRDDPGCHQLCGRHDVRRPTTRGVVLYRQPHKGRAARKLAHRHRSDHDG